MDNRDLLGKEIESLLKEDADNIHLSNKLMEDILNSREKTWREKLEDFLNKEIEIPLAPAIVGFAALLLVSIIPKDIFKNQDVRVINIGSSQVFIKEKEVSRKWKLG